MNFEVITAVYETLQLLDQSKELSVEEVVKLMEEETVLEWVHKNCTEQNRNYSLSPSETQALEAHLASTYASVTQAHDHCIENNGLVYLAWCLFDIIQRELAEGLCSESI